MVFRVWKSVKVRNVICHGILAHNDIDVLLLTAASIPADLIAPFLGLNRTYCGLSLKTLVEYIARWTLNALCDVTDLYCMLGKPHITVRLYCENIRTSCRSSPL